MEYGSDFSWDQKLINEQFDNPKLHSRITKPQQNNTTDFQKLFNDIINNSKKSTFVSNQNDTIAEPPRIVQKNTTDFILTLTQTQIYFIILVIFALFIIAVCKKFDNLNQKIEELTVKIGTLRT